VAGLGRVLPCPGLAGLQGSSLSPGGHQKVRQDLARLRPKRYPAWAIWLATRLASHRQRGLCPCPGRDHSACFVTGATMFSPKLKSFSSVELPVMRPRGNQVPRSRARGTRLGAALKLRNPTRSGGVVLYPAARQLLACSAARRNLHPHAGDRHLRATDWQPRSSRPGRPGRPRPLGAEKRARLVRAWSGNGYHLSPNDLCGYSPRPGTTAAQTPKASPRVHLAASWASSPVLPHCRGFRRGQVRPPHARAGSRRLLPEGQPSRQAWATAPRHPRKPHERI